MGLVGGALAACTPAHQIKPVVPGRLTVTTAMYPPFDIPAADGSMAGVEGDILTKIAEMECLKVDAKQVDPGAAVQYVLTGKADLTAGDWYATAARAKVLGLSKPLYFDGMGIYSRAGYAKFADLKGKPVGTIQGYSWVSDMQNMFGDDLKLYPTSVAMEQDLASGRIETGIDGLGVGLYAQKKGGYSKVKIRAAEPDPLVRASVEPAQVVFLYSKENEAFANALNADIETLKKRGAIADIMKSYGLDPRSADVGPARLVQ